MTLKDKIRFQRMLGYAPCFVTWGNQTGTHICIRPMAHDGDHWSGCCDTTINRESFGDAIRQVEESKAGEA